MKIHDASLPDIQQDWINGVPGLYRNVPANIYHAHPALSNSKLQPMIRKCPAAFAHRESVPFESTEDMAMGSAFHALLLEPQVFRDRYEIGGINPKTGQSFGFGTDAWEEKSNAALAREKILCRTQWPIQGMAESVLAHPDVRAIIEAGGERELSMLWIDDETGALLRGRIDFLAVTNTFLDFKKTQDAGFGFDSSAVGYGYIEQYAMYHDGLLALTGVSMDGFLVPVEEEFPHLVGTVRFSPEGDQNFENTETSAWLHCGRVSYRKAIAAVQKCRKEGRWPSYEDRSVRIPEWYIKKNGGGT